MDKNIKFWAHKRLFSNKIDLAISYKNESTDTHYIAKKVSFKKSDRADIIVESLTFSIESAQMLVDQLWDCGIRPSQGSGSAGALAATQRHLEDFRKLLFNKEGI